jgi:hypothetical protein
MQGLTGQGVHYSAERARVDLLAPENGEHVWITIAVYRMSVEQMRAAGRGQQTHLDMENIAQVSTCCFVCEQAYSDRLSYRKCPGEPSE